MSHIMFVNILLSIEKRGVVSLMYQHDWTAGPIGSATLIDTRSALTFSASLSGWARTASPRI